MHNSHTEHFITLLSLLLPWSVYLHTKTSIYPNSTAFDKTTDHASMVVKTCSRREASLYLQFTTGQVQLSSAIIVTCRLSPTSLTSKCLKPAGTYATGW